jgi:hypothetical protein
MRTSIWILFALTFHAASPRVEAQYSCPAKVESFAGEKPILTLPAKYRDGIIGVVLPDLMANANASGYEPEDLRPAKLLHNLTYLSVSTSQANDRLWIVRFNTHQACGAHDGCPSYILSSSSTGVRNLFEGHDSSSGTSAGGAAGIAILPERNTAHPELLFLNHLSAFETAVGCFVWNKGKYHATPCSAECAHFMDTSRPQ